MAVGPVRGGGPNPAIQPLTRKPAGADADPTKPVLEKAVDGVLKPGQHMTMPARTGMAHFADHFDARIAPEYDKLLKGETQAEASASKAAAEEAPPEAHADEAATAWANESAMAMLDLLPQIPVPPPIPMSRPALARDVEDMEEEEEARRERHENPEPEPQDGDDEGDEELAFVARRTLELQAGTFTLDEGSIDVGERRLCTLEAFLDGDVPFVSCAVDMNAISDGTELRIPALDAAAGRPVRLRAVHQTARTEGVGAAYLEVCVSDPDAWRSVLDSIVAVHVG
ncbi:MAG: hypothetical protein JST54_28815 [Deltaproteobacteria bacterium]|nr:hypothetical protein [Deltaproteobacteria bacterium]